MQDIMRTIEIMECDYHRTLPPKMVLEHALNAVLLKMRASGGDRLRLYDACGAVWMITHMRFEQYFVIVPEDTLRIHVSPRAIEGNHYNFRVKMMRGEDLAVEFYCAFVPVYKQERHIVRLPEVEQIWTEPSGGEIKLPLRRLRTDCEFVPCGSDTVRMSDCDTNHHLTSSAYLALACNALGYWDGSDTRYMKAMQIDYTSEVLPGTLLRFERGEEDGAKFVRGIKPDGRVSFTARCVFD